MLEWVVTVAAPISIGLLVQMVRIQTQTKCAVEDLGKDFHEYKLKVDSHEREFLKMGKLTNSVA